MWKEVTYLSAEQEGWTTNQLTANETNTTNHSSCGNEIVKTISSVLIYIDKTPWELGIG